MRLVAPVFFLFRTLVVVLVALYFVLAIGVITLRYVVLPQVDTWLPQVELAASRALGLDVEIQALSASWHRLHPELELAEVTLRDSEGQVVLALPQVRARLSWQTVIRQRPELLHLWIDAPQLSVRRSADGTVALAGIPLFHTDPNRAGDALDSPEVDQAPRGDEAESGALAWLRNQRDIQVHDARLEWVDATGQLPSTVLESVDLRWRSGRLRGQRLALQVPGSFPGGENLDIRVHWREGLLANLAHPANWGDWRGAVYVAASRANLAWWRPWLGARAPVHLQGLAAFRLWGEFEADVAPRWHGNLALRNVSWQGLPRGPALALSAAAAKVQVSEGDLQLQWQASQGLLALPRVFAHPLPLESSTGSASSPLQELPDAWEFHEVVMHAGRPGERAGGVLQGEWRATHDSPLGVARLKGELLHGEVGAITRFTPLQANDEVSEWLRGALRAGSLISGHFELEGPLQHFPFAEESAALGHFHLAAEVSDVAIDIVPDEQPGWPLFSQLSGQLTIDADDLFAEVEQGEIRLDSTRIAIEPSRLSIIDMDSNSRLDVQANTQGEAAAYLAWLKASPLLAAMDEIPEDLTLSGNLSVPVRVQLPLGEDEDIAERLQVEGAVQLAGNSLSLQSWPDALDDLQGRVDFSRNGAEFVGMQGKLRGDPFTLDGDASENGEVHLDWRGSVAEAALQPWLPPGLKGVVTGRTPVRALLRRTADGSLSGEVQSNLIGLALHAPPPLNKPAASSWPLKLSWERGGRDTAITARWQLANLLHGATRWRPSQERVEAFALGVPGQVALPERGWRIDIRQQEINLDDWRQWWQQRHPESLAIASDEPPWSAWPKPIQLQLASQKLQVGSGIWPDIELNLEVTDNDLLRLQLDSPQAAGWLGWRPASAAGPARVEAVLDRLHIQTSGDEANEMTEDVLRQRRQAIPERLPYVDLDIEALSWNDIALGKLTIDAHPLPNQDGWRFAELRLQNPHLELHGEGSWQAPVAARTDAAATSLQWQGKVLSVAGMLDSLGLEEVVAGGHGETQGSARWPGAPWHFALRNLVAELSVDLTDGRFLPVSDGAGRLLSVLSLQTLARTVTFQNEDLFASGFAWDSLRAAAVVDHGRLQVRGFDMRGSSAAALLSGEVNLINETQDLTALILPRIDASGAALLAGVAINPIVGVGAFLTQWLLREPLARALSLEYTIGGTWDEPVVARRREPATADAPRIEPVP